MKITDSESFGRGTIDIYDKDQICSALQKAGFVNMESYSEAKKANLFFSVGRAIDEGSAYRYNVREPQEKEAPHHDPANLS